MNNIVIYGAGGFGREVVWLIQEINRVEKKYNLLGFVDDTISLKGKMVNGYPVLGSAHSVAKNTDGQLNCALAVGDPFVRYSLYEKIKKLNLGYPNLIHPSVLIGDDVVMGIGNIICARCILTVNIQLGNFCQLNLMSTVGHDCRLDDYTTSACNVDFGGGSSTGMGAYFGNQSTLLPSNRVGSFSVVGAGAVVNRDIPDGVVAVGVPAKIIKSNRIFDKVKQELETLTPDPKAGRPFH